MKREDRYLVFKRKDLAEFANTETVAMLERLRDRIDYARMSAGKDGLSCVVVESDWPEYEPTWQAIEARMEGGICTWGPGPVAPLNPLVRLTVPKFWLQPTRSFKCAPQREEYDTDADHDLACERYATEWRETYICGNAFVDAERIAAWCGGYCGVVRDARGYAVAYCIIIPTLEGDMRADLNDWIIKGVKGEFYTCKPDIFAATYDPAADAAKGESS